MPSGIVGHPGIEGIRFLELVRENGMEETRNSRAAEIARYPPLHPHLTRYRRPGKHISSTVQVCGLMRRLENITLEELQKLRDQTDGEIPRERVLAAIGRKQGDSLRTLAERHGVVEKSIRNWLDRFADQPLEQAPYDEPRPGRPSGPADDQLEQLLDQL